MTVAPKTVNYVTMLTETELVVGLFGNDNVKRKCESKQKLSQKNTVIAKRF